eukprot:5629255-Prymnesium_polylepis.1
MQSSDDIRSWGTCQSQKGIGTSPDAGEQSGPVAGCVPRATLCHTAGRLTLPLVMPVTAVHLGALREVTVAVSAASRR